MNHFVSVPEALKMVKAGKPLILTDSPRRENEGDFFIAAQKATPSTINFFLKYGRGLLNVALSYERAASLGVYAMVPKAQNTEKTGVNMAVSLDAKRALGFGASVSDRTTTIKLLGNPKAAPENFSHPGHVFPLIAHPKGLKARAGQTEASVALCALAGLVPAGVICEILTEAGSMARMGDLKQFSAKFKIPILQISELQKFIKTRSIPVQKIQTRNLFAEADLPTIFGKFRIAVFKSPEDGKEHVALWIKKQKNKIPLVRVHSQCLTGDTLFSLRCDCGQQLLKSVELIAQRGHGALIYLNQEGRGIGLFNKIKAYALQDRGLDTVEANQALGFAVDGRNFGPAAAMLKKINMDRIQLLTNNPDKVKQLSSFGIKIVGRVALEMPVTKQNRVYMATKKNKLGHLLSMGK